MPATLPSGSGSPAPPCPGGCGCRTAPAAPRQRSPRFQPLLGAKSRLCRPIPAPPAAPSTSHPCPSGWKRARRRLHAAREGGGCRTGPPAHTCGSRRGGRGSHLDLQRHQAHLAALADHETLGQVDVLAPLLGEQLHHELAVYVYLVPVEAEELLDQQLVAGAVGHGRWPGEDGEAEEDGHGAATRRRAASARRSGCRRHLQGQPSQLAAVRAAAPPPAASSSRRGGRCRRPPIRAAAPPSSPWGRDLPRCPRRTLGHCGRSGGSFRAYREGPSGPPLPPPRRGEAGTAAPRWGWAIRPVPRRGVLAARPAARKRVENVSVRPQRAWHPAAARTVQKAAVSVARGFHLMRPF